MFFVPSISTRLSDNVPLLPNTVNFTFFPSNSLSKFVIKFSRFSKFSYLNLKYVFFCEIIGIEIFLKTYVVEKLIINNPTTNISQVTFIHLYFNIEYMPYIPYPTNNIIHNEIAKK